MKEEDLSPSEGEDFGKDVETSEEEIDEEDVNDEIKPSIIM